MYYLRKYIAHMDGHIQLFPAFPNEGFFHSLPGLYLAAHKFPKQSTSLVCGSLADQKSIPIPNQRCDDLYQLLAHFFFLVNA